MMTEDLWSRRYSCRRIPVPFEVLQIQVAREIYFCNKPMERKPVFNIDNELWIWCQHDAADSINDCIEMNYLECAGDGVCNLLIITLKGSQNSSWYTFIKSSIQDWISLIEIASKISSSR